MTTLSPREFENDVFDCSLSELQSDQAKSLLSEPDSKSICFAGQRRSGRRAWMVSWWLVCCKIVYKSCSLSSVFNFWCDFFSTVAFIWGRLICNVLKTRCGLPHVKWKRSLVDVTNLFVNEILNATVWSKNVLLFAGYVLLYKLDCVWFSVHGLLCMGWLIISLSQVSPQTSLSLSLFFSRFFSLCVPSKQTPST